jgi:Uma2 family endonuclease
MSTADAISASVYPVQSVVLTSRVIPRLENGDGLSREEFERRYDAMPNIKKAELIEGIVYMASPVRMSEHGEPHLRLSGWMTTYLAKTPGLRSGDNVTCRLDDKNEPQPDLLLMLPQALGGRGWVDEDGYVSGAPDLVIEIAASTSSIDLGKKLEVYRRSGVREYLVYRTLDQAIDWLELVDGRYVGQALNADGRLESKLFPGLWLDPLALMAGDLAKVLATVDEGTKSAAHAEFVAKLQVASSQ